MTTRPDRPQGIWHGSSRLRHSTGVLLSLVAGSVGGALFFWLSAPLPWMLGSMLLVAATAVCGAPMRRSIPLRKIMIAVMGLLLGSSFSADTLSQLGAWSLVALLVSSYVILMTGVSLGIFRRLGRVNLPTAYFSSMPGGLGPMTVAGEEAGGDSQLIPIAHVIRIFCVVITVPLYLTLVRGVDLGPQTLVLSSGGASPDWHDWMIWCACAIAGFWGARAVGIPFGEILGPMLLCACAYILEIITVPLPQVVTIAAQVVIGTSIGAQFSNLRVGRLFWPTLAAASSTVLMLTGALILAEVMAALLDVDPLSLMLALVPGGLVEMGLIAVSIDADTAFISAMHIFRIILVTLTEPLLFRFFWRGA